MFDARLTFFMSSPDRSSITEIPSAFAKGSIRLTSGKPWPVSHLLTALLLTNTFSASSSCVIFLSSRSFLMTAPVTYLSMATCLLSAIKITQHRMHCYPRSVESFGAIMHIYGKGKKLYRRHPDNNRRTLLGQHGHLRAPFERPRIHIHTGRMFKTYHRRPYLRHHSSHKRPERL